MVPRHRRNGTRTLLVHVLNDLTFGGGTDIPLVTDVTDMYLRPQMISDLTFVENDRHSPVTDVTDAYL